MDDPIKVFDNLLRATQMFWVKKNKVLFSSAISIEQELRQEGIVSLIDLLTTLLVRLS